MPSARRLLADLSVFGRGYLRSRVGVFFALIFPVILILLFGAIFSGGGSGPVNVYYQNHDSGPVGDQFVSALNKTGLVTMMAVPNSENFSQFLLSKSASEGLVIPSDFSSTYAEPDGRVNVTVYQNPASSTSQIVAGITQEVADRFNLYHANAKASPVLGLDTKTIASASYKYIDFLVPGLVGFSILTSPMFALVTISSEYKRDKISSSSCPSPL